MANFVFNSTISPDFISVTVDDNTFEIPKNFYRGETSTANPELCWIKTIQTNQSIWQIIVGIDSIDIDGTTSFANGNAVREALRAIFFLADTGGGGDVSSFNGRTGAVVPVKGDYTTDLVPVKKVLGTTHDDTLASQLGHIWSSNIDRDGFGVTDNGDGTIDLSAGSADVRETNDEQAKIILFDIPAKEALSLTNNVTNYVYVWLDTGVPTVSVTQDIVAVFSRFDWAVGWAITRVGNTLHVLDIRGQATNYANNANIKDVQVNGFEKASGADLVINGSNQIILGDGVFYLLNRPIATNGIDTTASGTFTNVYQDGGGGWTRTTGQTVLPIDNWDNGSGTLQNAGNNDYINLWLHIVHNNPAEYQVLIGQQVFSTVLEAYVEGLPPLRPPELGQFSTGDELYQITYRGNGTLERVLDLKVNAGRVVGGAPIVVPTQFDGSFVWSNAEEGAAPGGFSVLSVPTFTSSIPMGISVESDSVLKYLSIMLYSSTAAAAGDFTITIERFEKNAGSAYTPGAGTVLTTLSISSTGVLPPLFYRNIVDDTLNITVGGTDPILFCHISNIGFWSISGGLTVSTGGNV